MKETPIRSLLIGTGGIANSHARGFAQQADKYHLAACVDIDITRAKDFAEKYNIPHYFEDTATALATIKPQFVDICTPPQPHAHLSIQAMEAGCDVLCEKPLCASLAEFEQIQKAEERTGRFCASVFQFRYAPSTQHVKRLIVDGVIGKPLVAVCNTTWYRDAGYYEVPWRGKWSNELGGPTMGHGIHAMDQLLFLLGPWTEVTAYAATVDRPIEVEDVSVVLIRFANGAIATVVNSIVSPRQETYLRIDCQEATVELTHLYEFGAKNWSITAKSGNWDPPERVPSEAIPQAGWRFPEPDAPSTHGTQLSVLAGNIHDRIRPVSSGLAARQTLELISAIYKSAYLKQPIRAGTIMTGDPFYNRINGGHAKAPE
jgi:predicted dehydrogenase